MGTKTWWYLYAILCFYSISKRSLESGPLIPTLVDFSSPSFLTHLHRRSCPTSNPNHAPLCAAAPPSRPPGPLHRPRHRHPSAAASTAEAPHPRRRGDRRSGRRVLPRHVRERDVPRARRRVQRHGGPGASGAGAREIAGDAWCAAYFCPLPLSLSLSLHPHTSSVLHLDQVDRLTYCSFFPLPQRMSIPQAMPRAPTTRPSSSSSATTPPAPLAASPARTACRCRTWAICMGLARTWWR